MPMFVYDPRGPKWEGGERAPPLPMNDNEFFHWYQMTVRKKSAFYLKNGKNYSLKLLIKIQADFWQLWPEIAIQIKYILSKS